MNCKELEKMIKKCNHSHIWLHGPNEKTFLVDTEKYNCIKIFYKLYMNCNSSIKETTMSTDNPK